MVGTKSTGCARCAIHQDVGEILAILSTQPGVGTPARRGRVKGLSLSGFWLTLSVELPMRTWATARQLTTKPEMMNSKTSVDPTRLAAKLDAAIVTNLKELGNGG